MAKTKPKYAVPCCHLTSQHTRKLRSGSSPGFENRLPQYNPFLCVSLNTSKWQQIHPRIKQQLLPVLVLHLPPLQKRVPTWKDGSPKHVELISLCKRKQWENLPVLGCDEDLDDFRRQSLNDDG
eukprot:11594364-Ditylum_brightwellii.AAC.1